MSETITIRPTPAADVRRGDQVRSNTATWTVTDIHVSRLPGPESPPLVIHLTLRGHPYGPDCDAHEIHLCAPAADAVDVVIPARRMTLVATEAQRLRPGDRTVLPGDFGALTVGDGTRPVTITRTEGYGVYYDDPDDGPVMQVLQPTTIVLREETH